MKSIVTLLTAALALGAAQAEFKDGNRLYEQMNSKTNGDWFNAIGYITGVADAGRGVVSCPPDNVTAGQLFDVVKQQLESVPGARHFAADVIVNFVMIKHWPCPKKGSQL